MRHQLGELKVVCIHTKSPLQQHLSSISFACDFYSFFSNIPQDDFGGGGQHQH